MAAMEVVEARRDGDQITLTATLDGGPPVTVQFWKSHLDSLATTAAKRAYIGGLVKAAAGVTGGPAPIDLTALNGTV